MCGIWAVVGSLVKQPNIKDFLNNLRARGPEYTKCIDVSGALIGFTRLAINGLTDAGNQPFEKENTYSVCNGEIYNYKELASRHNIHLNDGTSDCAVLPTLYRKFCPNVFCRTLDGVFALIIYDTQDNTIFVARDPYGIRPLFEARFEDSIVWSSEVKAIPRGYKSIQQFPPGVWARYSLQGDCLDSSQYHSIPFLKLACFSGLYNRTEAKHALRESLISAVKKRLLSDRPVGALLSGGLDSSLVAAIAARELKAQGKQLSTFSIGMPGSTDLKYAELVAKHIGSNHHTIILSQDDFLKAIPDVIRAIESYDITTVRASVGNYLVGKYIRENTDIKVVLNGDGSDEIGGGYIYFYNAPSDEEFEEESERLLKEIHIYDVLRSDRCISAHGLEPRTPFLDKSVVATWRQMDTSYRRPKKVGPDGRGSQIEKQVLREAFETDNLLPYDVLTRKKEAFSDGVSAANDSWYSKCMTFASDQTINLHIYETNHNTPQTVEAGWYRQIFEQAYGPSAATLIPKMWMPKWVSTNDPSARTLKDLYE